MKNSLTDSDYDDLARALEGYSGSDISALLKEAALEAIREASQLYNGDLDKVPKEIRNISKDDITRSLPKVRPSVTAASLESLRLWREQYERHERPNPDPNVPSNILHSTDTPSLPNTTSDPNPSLLANAPGTDNPGNTENPSNTTGNPTDGPIGNLASLGEPGKLSGRSTAK